MAQQNGLIQIASHYSVEETVSRLQAAFREKGMQIFAVIDHSAARRKKLG